jgi:glycosyltransferase involved in cell wall biosynthesis
MATNLNRILALPKYPIEGASSRYCIYQFIPHIEANGIRCDVSPFMDASLFQLSMQKGRPFRKTGKSLLALLRRTFTVLTCRRYDLIFIHRELVPAMPPLLEWLLSVSGKPVVFIYDDALFFHKQNEFSPLVSLLKNPNKINKIFGMVDVVIGTNPYLAEFAGQYCESSVFLEIPEDLTHFPARQYASPPDKPVIGWLGSPSTEKYLHLLDAIFRELSEQYDFTLKIIGGGQYQSSHFEVVHERWSLETENAQLHTFDIGIMPLPDEEWSQGKSGGKARTYMAAGIPAVCSRIGYNNQLIKHRSTGYLVESQDEWFDSLSELLDDPAQRQLIGNNARNYLEEHLNLPGQADRLLDILTSAYHQKQK